MVYEAPELHSRHTYVFLNQNLIQFHHVFLYSQKKEFHPSRLEAARFSHERGRFSFVLRYISRMKNLIILCAALIALSSCHHYNAKRKQMKWIRGDWNYSFDSIQAHIYRSTDSTFIGGFNRPRILRERVYGKYIDIPTFYNGSMDFYFHDTIVRLNFDAGEHKNDLMLVKLTDNQAVFKADKGYPQEVDYSRKGDSMYMVVHDSASVYDFPMKLTKEDSKNSEVNTNTYYGGGHRYYGKRRH
jgi:hypothetical protein